jgi:hypothetical protein
LDAVYVIMLLDKRYRGALCNSLLPEQALYLLIQGLQLSKP